VLLKVKAGGTYTEWPDALSLIGLNRTFHMCMVPVNWVYIHPLAHITCGLCLMSHICATFAVILLNTFLPLGATAQGELSPPEQSAAILLCSSSFLPILSLSCSFADVDFRSVHPSEADCLVSEQFSFYGVRLLASRPTPNLDAQCIPLRLAPTP
jgi:hypothetical protein